MPKINIYDVDYKNPGVNLESNLLSVAIPGFVKDIDKFRKKADRNDVLICDNTDDFEEYIGFVEGQAQAHTYVKLLERTAGAEGMNKYIIKTYTDDNDVVHGLTGKDFYATYAGMVYTYAESQGGDDSTSDSIVQIANPAAAGSVQSYSYYKVTQATTWEAPTGEDNAIEYVIVTQLGAAASAETENKASIGNQLAYYLITAGYTVFYKAILPTDITSGKFFPVIECLADKSAYDFRFICSGVYTSAYFNSSSADTIYNNIANAIIAVAGNEGADAPGRKDCIALLDVDDAKFDGEDHYRVTPSKANLINDTVAGFSGIDASPYAAIFTPAGTYALKNTAYTNTKLPASYYYLLCFRNSVGRGYAEWYAAAGEIRGISSDAKALEAIYGDPVINILEPRKMPNEANISKAINVVANFRNVPMLWGNRTAAELGTSNLTFKHFLNIRHLVVTISKTLYKACRRFTFDPNSDVLWTNFTTTISPLLERMKATEGLRDYRIVKVKTDELAYLKAKIHIVPIEAVEDFDIEIALRDSLATVEDGNE